MSRIGIIGMLAIMVTLAACDSPADVPPGGNPGNGQPGTGQPGTGNPPTQHPHPAGIIFGGYSLPLVAGDTVRLTVRAVDAAGQEMNVPVVWTSADTTLATVTADGLMSARSGGTARINALVGSYPAWVEIPVRNRAAVLQDLSPRKAMVGSGPVLVTVTGRHFVEGARVHFGREVLPTIRISDTELRAEVPAQHLRHFGVAAVTVVNPLAQGPSDTASFVIERHPPVTTTYVLAGLHGGSELPVELDRFRFRHWQTGEEFEQVVRTITAGRLVLEGRLGEDTQFVAYHTETLIDVATGRIASQSELVWFGFLEYDALDGSLIFVSGGMPAPPIRGRHDAQGGIVLDRNLGGGQRSWRYSRM